MRPIQVILAVASVCTLLHGAYAQVPNLEPELGLDKPVPTISFEVAFPGDSAQHYVFSVESSGSAAYRSDNIGQAGRNENTGDEPYTLKFIISEATCIRIFNLAKQANYFKGKFSSINGPVENSSITTLTYREGPPFSFDDLVTNVVNNTTTYSFTKNIAIQKLAGIFEGIANSIELGRRIEYLRQFDRSALDAALRRAGESTCNHQLLELNAIRQSLRDVANDPSVTKVSRERAQQLLLLASLQSKSNATNPAWCGPGGGSTNNGWRSP